jgi:hypothetical protein
MWLFDPLDQELCVIWEACVIGDRVRVTAPHGDYFYYEHSIRASRAHNRHH